MTWKSLLQVSGIPLNAFPFLLTMFKLVQSSNTCRTTSYHNSEQQLFTQINLDPNMGRASQDICACCSCYCCWAIAECCCMCTRPEVRVPNSLSTVRRHICIKTDCVICSLALVTEPTVWTCVSRVLRSIAFEKVSLKPCGSRRCVLQTCLGSTRSLFEHGAAFPSLASSQTLSHANCLTR